MEKLPQSPGGDKGGIAIHHQHNSILVLKDGFGLQHGMTSAQWFGLDDEFQRVVPQLFPTQHRLTADHQVDFGGAEGSDCFDDITEHRFAQQGMKDFGNVRPHPHPFASSQYQWVEVIH